MTDEEAYAEAYAREHPGTYDLITSPGWRQEWRAWFVQMARDEAVYARAHGDFERANAYSELIENWRAPFGWWAYVRETENSLRP